MEGREKVKEMMTQKDKIEKEIVELYDVLASHGNLGMNEPLVDREGYPRNDVDVYQIRISRNRIACLQNDHKNLMKEIEQELHSLHSKDRIHRMEEDPPIQTVNVTIEDALQPFATINLVSKSSPADTAGLRAGDKILSFGSVNKSNFQSMQSIASVVTHSEGRTLEVRIDRDGASMRVMLLPKRWSGRGLLGCNIIPV